MVLGIKFRKKPRCRAPRAKQLHDRPEVSGYLALCRTSCVPTTVSEQSPLVLCGHKFHGDLPWACGVSAALRCTTARRRDRGVQTESGFSGTEKATRSSQSETASVFLGGSRLKCAEGQSPFHVPFSSKKCEAPSPCRRHGA